MSFSTDLSLLAESNIIGYDTYAQTLNGLGMNTRRGYNPFGMSHPKFNTGTNKDSFCSCNGNSSSLKYVKNGVLSALGFTLGTAIISEFQKQSSGKTLKQKIQDSIKNALKGNSVSIVKRGTRAKSAAKSAAKNVKGIKGFFSKLGNGLKKVGKGCKVGGTIIAIAGAGIGALHLYEKFKHRPLSDAPQQN
jgi:hypothetical protein